MIGKEYFVVNILNKPELICLHTVKWFQSLISNGNNSIYYESFVCTQVNGFNYCCLTLIILFNITHLFTHGEAVTSIAI